VEPYPPNGPPKLSHCRLSYALNSSFINWAFHLTQNTPLVDSEALQKNRARYKNIASAEKPPFVLKGDNITSDSFWHGSLLAKRAEDWVRYVTLGKGKYVTTSMEDSAILNSLLALSRAGKVDRNRIMVLRTACNYDRESVGWTAVESLQSGLKSPNFFSGYLAALENSYRVGSLVVYELVKNWSIYRETLPKK
jgi:purine nucleoside permease